MHPRKLLCPLRPMAFQVTNNGRSGSGGGRDGFVDRRPENSEERDELDDEVDASVEAGVRDELAVDMEDGVEADDEGLDEEADNGLGTERCWDAFRAAENRFGRNRANGPRIGSSSSTSSPSSTAAPSSTSMASTRPSYCSQRSCARRRLIGSRWSRLAASTSKQKAQWACVAMITE